MDFSEEIQLAKQKIIDTDKETQQRIDEHNFECLSKKVQSSYAQKFSSDNKNAFDQMAFLRSEVLDRLVAVNETLESCRKTLDFQRSFLSTSKLTSNRPMVDLASKKIELSKKTEELQRLEAELKQQNETLTVIKSEIDKHQRESNEITKKIEFMNKKLSGLCSEVNRFEMDLNMKREELQEIERKRPEIRRIIRKEEDFMFGRVLKQRSCGSSEEETEDSVGQTGVVFYSTQNQVDDLRRQKSLLVNEQAKIRNEINALKTFNYKRKEVHDFRYQQETQVFVKYFIVSVAISLLIFYPF